MIKKTEAAIVITANPKAAKEAISRAGDLSVSILSHLDIFATNTKNMAKNSAANTISITSLPAPYESLSDFLLAVRPFNPR
ncbi:urease beta subunit [Labrenzia sp. EL_126]|nr:urease beta subunit [Labrenzia sp. EL_126]